MSELSRRMAAIGVGTVLVAAVFAGCGGSDSDSGGALSKEDFIAQADEICAESDAASDAFGEDFEAAYGAGDFDAAAELIEEADATTSEATDEIKALEPPEEDQATVDELFELTDQQEALVPDLIEAVRAGDNAAVTEVADEAEALDTQTNAIADEYGFVDCGSAGDS